MDDEPSPYSRNKTMVDVWSATHVAWGIVLTPLLGPWWALLLLAVWEPVERFVLSPLLARFGIDFGREPLVNSVADLAFDVIGVAIGWYVVLPLWDPLGVV